MLVNILFGSCQMPINLFYLKSFLQYTIYRNVKKICRSINCVVKYVTYGSVILIVTSRWRIFNETESNLLDASLFHDCIFLYQSDLTIWHVIVRLLTNDNLAEIAGSGIAKNTLVFIFVEPGTANKRGKLIHFNCKVHVIVPFFRQLIYEE